MTGDPEAVTRALAEHRMVWINDEGSGFWECGCNEDGHLGGLSRWSDVAAHLAAVLASLPDDRLAEAEAKVERLQDKCAHFQVQATRWERRCRDAEAKVQRVEKHMAFRERLGSDSSPHYEIRAALSGGDEALTSDLRTLVRRIVERDIAGGADTTSLLHADILALLDADLEDLDAKSSERPSDVSDGLPDTPTADDPECCASGRCEVCSPGFDWARNGALPDAPVDDGKDKLDANLSDRASDDSDALLVEQIARVLDEYLGAHLFKTGDWSRRNVNAMALAVVVARPWQAEVER